MTLSPILFRCDGSTTQGYEPFYQCLNYAAALQRRRRGTYFLSQLQPATLLAAIQRGGNEWLPADNPVGSPEDLDQTLAEIRRLQPAAVVVADHNLDTDYLNAVARTGTLLVVVDSHASAKFPQGLVVNPFLAPTKDCYHFGPGTHLLLGARYAFVRPFIRRMRPLRAQEPAGPFRALIAFGDDDLRGQVPVRTKELLAMSRVDRVDVAVRPQHPALLDLLSLAEANPERLEVITEPADISMRLGRCHIALTSGDAWSLELACVGIPQIILLQAANHALNAQRLDDEGAANFLGDCDSVGANDLRDAVNELLSEPRDRARMARSGRKLIDGRGPDRLVNALEVLLHPARAVGDDRLAA